MFCSGSCQSARLLTLYTPAHMSSIETVYATVAIAARLSCTPPPIYLFNNYNYMFLPSLNVRLVFPWISTHMSRTMDQTGIFATQNKTSSNQTDSILFSSTLTCSLTKGRQAWQRVSTFQLNAQVTFMGEMANQLSCHCASDCICEDLSACFFLWCST